MRSRMLFTIYTHLR